VDISFVRARGTQDWIHVVRDDGSELKWPWVKAGGQLPHDLMHYLVETHLGVRDGFWGLVAKGVDFGFLAEAADRIATGASGTDLDGRDSAGLVLAECLVAGISTGVWTDADDDQCLGWIAGHCARRGIAMPADLTAANLAPVRAAIRQAAAAWRDLPIGAALDVSYSA
jgi:hypothetical protein